MSSRGQVSIELLAIISIILLIFLGVNAAVSKRNVDVQSFRDGSALETSLERASVLIDIAQYAPGAEFNVSLPNALDSCVPSYRIEIGFIRASCGGGDYIVGYLANVTGTGTPPFNISSDITIRGDYPMVVVTNA